MHERADLEAIRYQGIVCASLLLKRPLSPYYLTYITDEAPFTAVVEMSALVDRRHFDGRSLVYLPKYCAPRRPDRPHERRRDRGNLPRRTRAHVPGVLGATTWSASASRGFGRSSPIPTLGYSKRVPPMATSVPGVHLVTSAQIVNGTLNVNETVQLAERAARDLLGDDVRTADAAVISAVPAGRTRGRTDRSRSPRSRSTWTTCGRT